jgi:hypothetical protein
MVKLKNLNSQCARRKVAHAFPAQIACRILGNESVPCKLDPICKPCESKTVLYFYAIFAAAISSFFFLVFWILRLTRLSRPLGWLTRIFAKPLVWLCKIGARLYNFYKNLPF